MKERDVRNERLRKSKTPPPQLHNHLSSNLNSSPYIIFFLLLLNTRIIHLIFEALLHIYRIAHSDSNPETTHGSDCCHEIVHDQSQEQTLTLSKNKVPRKNNRPRPTPLICDRPSSSSSCPRVCRSRSCNAFLAGQETSVLSEEQPFSKSITMCRGLPPSPRTPTSSSGPPPTPSLKGRKTKAQRDATWEKRQRQIQNEEGPRNSTDGHITDEDLDDLRGCIELGFGFKEEQGQGLCNTLPALDLYFAVNRQVSPKQKMQHHHRSTSSPSTVFLSPSADSSSSEAAWKICTPGENPQQVKTKLRHWAQAVACSVIQSS